MAWKDKPEVSPVAARSSDVRLRGASDVFSGDGVRSAAMGFLLSGRTLRVGERTRERAREWHSEEEGVSRGLFIGTAGPQTARINCARSINVPGFSAHVRAVRGVTIASCNGHIVGHGVQPHSARSPQESRRQPLG